MVNYHIRKRKRTRYTFRLVGFAIAALCGSQVAMFFMGYGKNHKIGTFFAALFFLYGGYLFINSFKPRFYDTDYEFKENDFTVKMHRGEKTFAYSDITDLNMIIPQNENIYSIVQIVVGREQFLLPFTLKKAVADQIYSLLCQKTGRVPVAANEDTNQNSEAIANAEEVTDEEKEGDN